MDINDALDRYKRLKKYLDDDPHNSPLLFDTASAAFEAGELDVAVDLFEQLDRREPLVAWRANTAGIAAMRLGKQQMAQKWFRAALQDNPEEPTVRFNLAWSHALARDFEQATSLLTDEVVTALPQAATLDLQIDHELGRFEEAQGKIEDYLTMHPNSALLQSAVSVLAMDLGDQDLARQAAEQAGNHPDGLTTLGTLELGQRELESARKRFSEAIAINPDKPRAQIGLGLVELAEGDTEAATNWLDAGAERFGTHLGSWLAAGWAHFLAGNLDLARKRFEAAEELDGTFAEAHGSLAAIDVAAGDTAAASRRIDIALRLDRNCFSAALAAILVEEARGDRKRAEEIWRRALEQPILPDGSTLLDALIRSQS